MTILDNHKINYNQNHSNNTYLYNMSHCLDYLMDHCHNFHYHHSFHILLRLFSFPL